MGKWGLSQSIRSPRDYWKVGPIFVWKWLLLLLTGAAAVLILWFFGLPDGLWRDSGSGIPAYRYDDPALRACSGVVEILDGQGRVRYEGEVAAGSCTGQGKVYNADGLLVYDGPLVDGVYEGEGAKVYSQGVLIYEGAMAANLYEGEGRQYNADGVLIRSGTFSGGLLNGEGREYSADGVLLREGTFRDGLLHGSGTQYTSGGVLEYQGTFDCGIFHGQGALYDTLHQALAYDGTFVRGQATGTGRIYHPSGQLLYEGQVCEGQPGAGAFLGLSLAEVEAAFQEHWVLYSCEGTTAFVYPDFHLMFVTQIPVDLVSPDEQASQSEQERQALLQAISAARNPSPEEPTARQPATREPEGADAAVTGGAAGPTGDVELAQDTVKSDLLISEVLSYGAPLAGVAQPESNAVSGTRKAGWREWFSDYAAGQGVVGAAVVHTGPYVYEFVPLSASPLPDSAYDLAVGRGVESATVHRNRKDQAIWYQSAVRRDEP